MLLITTITYPPAVADQIGKKYLEIMDKYPDDASIGQSLVPAAVRSTLEGSKVVSIYNVNDGKLKEAIELATNRVFEFREIVGFQSCTEIAYDASEALGLLGLDAP